MKYVLEFSNMQGDGIADEDLSKIESDYPISLPIPGDQIQIQGTNLFVVNRVFAMYPEDDEVTQHVQVFCGTEDQFKKRQQIIAKPVQQ